MSDLDPARLPRIDLDQRICDREPIHVPGTIQTPGALLVANVGDLHITHVSANLGDGLLGRPLAAVVGAETMAEVKASMNDGGMNFGRVFSGVMPGTDTTPSDIVVHRYQDRIYVELEPAAEDDESAEVLLVRTQAVISALRRAQTRQELCETAVDGLRELTGFDRAMAYRFDTDANGEVIAEARHDALEPFHGLHYPASDIPPQARRLYLQQRVRVIGDVDYVSVPVLAAETADGRSPLDMTYCHLRGISSMHLQYLRNMKVGASLAISLVPEDVLWGMLICHHSGPRRISARMRAMCDLIGQVMSLLIGARGKTEALTERMARQDILDAIGQRTLDAPAVVSALLEDPDALLRLVNADGAIIRLGGQVDLIGTLPPRDQALDIAAAMRAKAGSEIHGTADLGQSCPAFTALADKASGVLSLPILYGPEDGITWFRSEAARTVTWGGNPTKAMEQNGNTMSPRTSFAAWRSIVQGQSAPWNDADLEVARELRRLVMTAMLRQAEMQSQLANLRYYDALTGLPNRRLLQERLTARAENPDAGEGSMIFLDLDRFKTVNDSLGHAVGDDLLVQAAERLVQHVPAEHLVVRLGGDEFVVLCEHTAPDEAQRIAHEVVCAFRTPFVLAGKPYRLTTSVGVATASRDPSDDMLRSADVAMYAAKREGGNQAITYDRRLQEASSSRSGIEQDLYEALERDEFELHFQPLLRIDSGAIFSFEALVRWRSPSRGFVSPNDFIPLAEETGLIVPIGAWVMREALRQVSHWRERFGVPITMSVNVSGQQAARSQFPAEVAAALVEANLPPAALIVEVTESILAQNGAVEHLAMVRSTGVRVAIDDFGTGYSSLAYLKRLPVDELKIDKLFVDQIASDAEARGLMEIVVQLGHLLGLDVVVEGVETEQQWLELERMGCDAAQGFWMSKPLPQPEAEVLLAATLTRISVSSLAA